MMQDNQSNSNNRRQRPVGASGRAGQKRSISSRMGLQKDTPTRGGAATPPRQRAAGAQKDGRRPPNNAQGRPQNRATAQMNPQRAGYQPGTARQTRRVTQAEQIRRRNQRRLLGAGIVLAVMIFGIVLSINLLFKITAFRVENFDRSTPADTGIYSEQQIIDTLGLAVGDKLFFSTAAKTKQLQTALPYLDDVQVDLQLPSTVVIKVHPATERFTIMYSGGWLVLSDTLKILRIEISQPEGLVLLAGSLPSDLTPTVGQNLNLQSYNSLLDSTLQATAESAQVTADQALATILDSLESEGVLNSVTAIDVRDLSDLKFTYEGRVNVLLGSANSLDYKLRMASTVLLDTDKGLAPSDHGTLDISQQQSSGDIRAYFQPDDPESEEENAEAEEEGEGDNG